MPAADDRKRRCPGPQLDSSSSCPDSASLGGRQQRCPECARIRKNSQSATARRRVRTKDPLGEYARDTVQRRLDMAVECLNKGPGHAFGRRSGQLQIRVFPPGERWPADLSRTGEYENSPDRFRRVVYPRLKKAFDPDESDYSVSLACGPFGGSGYYLYTLYEPFDPIPARGEYSWPVKDILSCSVCREDPAKLPYAVDSISDAGLSELVPLVLRLLLSLDWEGEDAQFTLLTPLDPEKPFSVKYVQFRLYAEYSARVRMFMLPRHTIMQTCRRLMMDFLGYGFPVVTSVVRRPPPQKTKFLRFLDTHSWFPDNFGSRDLFRALESLEAQGVVEYSQRALGGAEPPAYDTLSSLQWRLTGKELPKEERLVEERVRGFAFEIV